MSTATLSVVPPDPAKRDDMKVYTKIRTEDKTSGVTGDTPSDLTRRKGSTRQALKLELEYSFEERSSE